MSVPQSPWVLGHLGDLHAYEQALVLLIAFGPFVVLGVLVVVVRRRDLAGEQREHPQEGPSASHDPPT